MSDFKQGFGNKEEKDTLKEIQKNYKEPEVKPIQARPDSPLVQALGYKPPNVKPFVVPQSISRAQAEKNLSKGAKDAIEDINRQLSVSGIDEDTRRNLQAQKESFIARFAEGKPEVDPEKLAKAKLGTMDEDGLSFAGGEGTLENRIETAKSIRENLASGRFSKEQIPKMKAALEDLERKNQRDLATVRLADSSQDKELVPLRSDGLLPAAYPKASPDQTPLVKVSKGVNTEQQSSGEPGIPVNRDIEKIPPSKISALQEALPEKEIEAVLLDMDKNPESPGWGILDLLEAFTKGYSGQGGEVEYLKRKRLEREDKLRGEDVSRAEQERLANLEARRQEIEANRAFESQQSALGRGLQRELQTGNFKNALELAKLNKGVGLTPNFEADAASLFD